MTQWIVDTRARVAQRVTDDCPAPDSEGGRFRLVTADSATQAIDWTPAHRFSQRPAEPFELEEIREEIARHMGVNHWELPECAAVIFPHYITDGPGYANPVALVLWGGAPDNVTVLTTTEDRHHWRVNPQGDTPRLPIQW